MISTWLSFALVTATNCSCARCVGPLTANQQDCVPWDMNPNVSEAQAHPKTITSWPASSQLGAGHEWPG